jgi:2-keto-myo-inositol isomerase
MISRRAALKGLALATGGTLAGSAKALAKAGTTNERNFSYCLNTSTISGQKTGFLKEFEIASKAGYDGIEIWVRDLEKYVQEGGSLKDLKKYTSDLGIVIENAIGFAQWGVDDAAARKAGMEQMKREMEMLAQTGCKRIAAPPAGATSLPLLDLFEVGKRYGEVLKLGRQTSVLPQLEFWGASANLYHISQALFVAAAADHPDACILPDVYHMFRGGSSYHSLKLMSGSAIEMFHFNDFVASIPREQQKDADRVYPGDGAAPFSDIIKYLKASGGVKVLSLELFNKTYWEQDALEVAKTGLEKMKNVVNEN